MTPLEPWMLALLAAAGFACYTIAIERGLARTAVEGSPVLAAAFYSTVVVTAGFWALALARGIPVGALSPSNVWPFVVAGIAYPGLLRFFYYEGIDRVGSSITAAVLGAYPAISVLLAVLVLGDGLNLFAAAGVVLIVGGVGILQLAQETADGVGDVIAEKLAAAKTRDLLYPAAAAVCTGGAFVLIDFGLTDFPDPVVATAITQTPALLIFTAWAGLVGARAGKLRLGRPALLAFAVAGVFNFIGWLGNFFALQSGSVITVVPLINMSPLLIVAITYSLERQIPRSKRVLAAVVVIVVGASLVQVGS